MKHPQPQKPIDLDNLNQIKRFNDVRYNRAGDSLFWLESIGGQGRIFQQDENQQLKISGEYNVRGTVGYGGGGFDAGKSKLVFSASSGALYQVDLSHQNTIKQISPAWGNTAAPAISPNEHWVMYVYQQREINGLAAVRMHGLTWPIQLVMGADFYMQPAWHPAGKMITWSEWNHPHMPWDASCVKIGTVGGMQLRLFEEHWIDGSAGAAASQPRFSPDGKWLSYIRRERNWDSLILYNLKDYSNRTLISADGHHLCLPNWIQGMRSYGWGKDSQSVFTLRNLRGRATLWKTNLRSGKSAQMDIQPVSWAAQLDISAKDNQPTFLGTTDTQPKQIWQISNLNLAAVVKNDAAGIETINISEPQEIIFSSGKQSEVFGIYFPPTIGSPSSSELPALILDIHGGPTAQDYLCFSSEAAYFTSRGFAYAQINYRGSSGFGYAYQKALKHSWGEVDVEDTLNFAQELVKRRMADPSKLVLKGSSAGGFTALTALMRKPGLFRAAICSYAVGNLVDDAQNTHKFERFYHRFLTGNFENNYQRFEDRSPIFHIDEIKDPVALFHGDSDKVVSPEQSKEIYKQLVEQSVPCQLKIYKGEGHGFRKPETIKDYYQSIEAFLKKHLTD